VSWNFLFVLALILVGPEMQEAIARAQTPDYPGVLERVQHAQTLQVHGRYQEAESLLRITWDELRAAGFEDLRLVIVLSGLGSLYREVGKYAEAGRLLERALHLAERDPIDRPEFSSVVNDLMKLYVVTGQLAKADALHRRVERLMVGEALGPNRCSAMLSEGLAGMYLAQRKYRDAEPLYEQALRTWRSLAGPEAYQTGVALNNLAVVYSRTRRYEQAIPLFERAEEILERTIGRDQVAFAACQANRADVYSAMRHFERAIEIQNRAISVLEARLGPKHPAVADVLLRHARTLRESGDKPLAKRCQARANAILSAYRNDERLNSLVIDVRALGSNQAGQN
jgi:tetratricopeptide (TPR) repeat protein